MSSLQENCRETANERIKTWNMLFTKNMQPIAECGADLNGEGEI